MLVLKLKLPKGEVLFANKPHREIPSNIPLVCEDRKGSICNGVEECDDCALSGTDYGCNSYAERVIKPKFLTALAKINSQIKAQ